MLTNLTIKNYVIIDLLELEFSYGLTALTGETGAGKSILLGALGLVLGDRADSDTIKQGKDFAEISAEFDIKKLTDVIRWLKQQDLCTSADGEFECNLRRRITNDGRSRAHINGTPVNLSLLRELSEMLIDIHGQHEHQSLMKPGIQRQLLDDYANHPALLNEIKEIYSELLETNNHLKKLESDNTDKTDQLKLLKFQTEELLTLALDKNEYQELDERHKLLANSEKLISSTQHALNTLHESENFSIQSELARTIAALQECTEIDENLMSVVELLSEAQIQIDEGISELNNYATSLSIDPSELQTVEQRIQSIHDIARKHHVEPEALEELHQKLTKELDDIDNHDERLGEVRARVKKLKEQYIFIATALSEKRKSASLKLNKEITSAMQKLGMKGGEFEINITPLGNQFSPNGSDKIEFTVSANAGNKCKALAKVASGGELARISLAIQIITTKQSKISTLIFDEVDSGVGGGIAEIVGQHLRKLGKTNQVMCITHLAQVASQAHHHMKVHKASESNSTNTVVDELDKKQRIEETARMLSGVDITQESLAHAKEMITRALS